MSSSFVGRVGRGARLGVLVLACALAGCSESTGLDEGETGIEATWAGKRWSGDAGATLAHGDTLYLYGSTPRNAGQLPAQGVRFRVVFRGPGSYSLGRGDAELDYLVGGDVVSAQYVTTRANAGTMQVTEYANGWLAGTVSFDAELGPSSYAPVGTRARFEGAFRARVSTWP